MGLHSQRAILMRGDPGLFDILKKVGKAALGFVPGGQVVQTGLSFAGGFPLPGRPGRPLPRPSSIAPPRGVSPRISEQPALATAGGCPKGFHINRSSYFTLAGFVEKGTMCVRNRRRNLSNGRANTRALRRMTAWEKQDKKRRQTLAAIARSAK